MAAVKPVAQCPVGVGIAKDEGQAAKLHRYTVEKNLQKMEKLLQKGVEVDCVNHLGQTPLFCAALLGLTRAVELLLQYGANPNHRSEDRSTPVHAAVFSCKPRLLSALLDAGGDLRLHDQKGRTPQDWAESGAQEPSQKMLDFLKSCESHMHAAFHANQPHDFRRNPGSSRTMLHARSLLEFLMHGGSGVHMRRKRGTDSSVCDTVQCYGFGKLCIDRPRQLQGLLACLPTIPDSELRPVDDEQPLSYPCGSLTQMTNKSWRGSRVTVKELQPYVRQQYDNQDGYLDLLIIEQEFCSQLFHPHLLQLLAVSVSEDLQQTKLVFERVHVRPLHCLLHYRRDLLPVLGTEVLLLSVVPQVCEALLFLHDRGLVMRSLSSHSVQIVHTGVAKVTGLGFMVPSSEGDGPGSPAHLPLPMQLYNWAAPEAIRQKACTWKADFYSLCALIQELYTGDVPWGPVDPLQIKQAVLSDRALAVDQSIPEPFYQLVTSGLQPRAHDRTSSLQDLSYLIRSTMRDLCWNGMGGSRLQSVEGAQVAADWSPESMLNKEQEHMCALLGCKPIPVRDAEQEQECGLSDSMVEGEPEDQMNHQEKLFQRTAKWKRWWNGGDPGTIVKEQEEALVDSTQSSLQVNTSQDEGTPKTDLDSPQKSRSEVSSTQDELEGAREQSVSQQKPASKECENIGSVVLNLKVSQALLQESERSLDAIEVAGWGRRPASQADLSTTQEEILNLSDRVDKVDGPAANILREDGHGSSLTSATQAAGPPTAWYIPVSQCPLHLSSCVWSETEDTAFHTIDWTLRMMGGGHMVGEGSFESAHIQSPVEPCSMFFTPSLEPHAHPTGRCSQTPSSEEDLEVTVEVCLPAVNEVEAVVESMCGGSLTCADEVDYRVTESESQGFSTVGSGASLTRAAGPPSSCYLPPCDVRTRPRTLKAQQLQGAHNDSLPGMEDVSEWQKECPPSIGRDMEDPSSDGEEQSLYTSAQEESFVIPFPTRTQVDRDNVSSGMTERRGQQSGTEPQSISKQWGRESTYVSSADSQDEHPHEWSDSPNKTKWTTETPTAHLQRHSPRSIDVELLAHMQRPLQAFSWSSSTPQPQFTDTFATTSTTDPSVSSILLSPVLSLEDTDTPTNRQDLSIGSSGQKQAAGVSGSQGGMCHGSSVPRHSVTAQQGDPEGNIQAGRRAEAATRNSGDSESEESDPGSSDSGCADSFCSTIIPDELPNAGGGAFRNPTLHGEGQILSDEQERKDDEDMSEEEEMPHDEEASSEDKASAGQFGLKPTELCFNTPGEKGQEMRLSAEDLDLLEDGDRQQERKGKDAGDGKSSALELASQTDDPGVDSHQKPQ